MEFQRSRRIGEQIHKEISSLLIKGVKDPRLEFVTITAVEVTPDLHLARIFYTVRGSQDEARRAAAAGLKKAIPFFRRELARRIRTRYMPDLLFVYDSSLEYGNRIESLIEQTKTEQSDVQADSEED